MSLLNRAKSEKKKRNKRKKIEDDKDRKLKESRERQLKVHGLKIKKLFKDVVKEDKKFRFIGNDLGSSLFYGDRLVVEARAQWETVKLWGDSDCGGITETKVVIKYADKDYDDRVRRNGYEMFTPRPYVDPDDFEDTLVTILSNFI